MGKRLWIFLGLLFFGASASEAQLYVSKKACLVDPNAPVTSPGTGTGTGTPPASCDEKAYFFEATSNNFGSWTWDFGDGTVRAGEIRNPAYTYTTPGIYTVTVSAIDNGGAVLGGPHSKEIKVGYYPSQPLFDSKTEKDSTICKGKTITLDPYEGTSRPSNVSYKWFPAGETTSTIEVSEAGCYSVEVIDNITGCSRSAKINVKLCFEDASSGGGSEKWYFGYGSGLEFTLSGDEMVQDSLSEDGSLDPQPEIENPSFDPSNPGVNEMQADEAAAMVYDQNNNLVLYTDGKKLYSGDDDSEIPNADGSSFSISVNAGAQGLALVPKPVCSACDFINYYLFKVDETTGLLTYSVIDMRENDRKGAVVETDVPRGGEYDRKDRCRTKRR
ncbi:MAG: PKD domain-containing protein [Leadbetterella sp.]|nr:PKD domain-containing protein [Leadbetterella sp.]